SKKCPALVPGIFIFICRNEARPPAGEHPEAASLTPFTLAIRKRRGSPLSYADMKSHAHDPDGDRALEWQQDLRELLTPGLLLNVGDLTAPAKSEARLCDLGRVDGVVALDVFRAHDAGDDHL